MIAKIYSSPRHHRLRMQVAGILTLAIVALSLAIPNSGYSAESQRVIISKSAYEPKELTVLPGTTVVWINRDEMPHTVTSRERAFMSKGLDTDDQFEHTFEHEGDFQYYCTVHPFMSGVVHVRR